MVYSVQYSLYTTLEQVTSFRDMLVHNIHIRDLSKLHVDNIIFLPIYIDASEFSFL